MTIATIISITGQAWARDASGDLRELRVGDTLQEGETLVTSDTGRVILDFADGLDPTVIGEGQEVAISADLDAEQPVAAEEASVQDEDLEALLAALEEGEGDLLEGLDATAAGAGGAGGPGGGHDFVRIARITEILNPRSFEFGQASLDGAPEFEDQAVEEPVLDEPTVEVGNAELSAGDVTVTEGDTAVFGVQVTNAAAGSSLTLSLADGTALDADYFASGDGGFFEYSTDGGSTWSAITGAIALDAGDTTLQVRTDTIDDAIDENAETFSLNAVLTSNGQTVTDAATATIEDNDEPTVEVGNPELSAGDVTVTEGDTAVFGVQVTNAAAGSSLTLSLADGTALDADYFASGDGGFFEYSTDGGSTWNAITGAIALDAGDTTLQVRTDTIDDAIDENAETFSLNAALTSNGQTVTDAATATIEDNDEPTVEVGNPELSAGDVTVTEGDTAVFGVQVTNAAAGSSLTLSLADGTALDADYFASGDGGFFEYSSDGGSTWSAITGAIALDAGDTTLQVRTDTIDDAIDESAETFSLNAVLTSNGQTVTDAATATIEDNDEPTVEVGNPELSAGDVTVTEGDTAVFGVQVTNAAAGSSLTLSLADGTALDADYFASGDGGFFEYSSDGGSTWSAITGAIALDAGDTTLQVRTDTIDDAIDESAETFSLNAVLTNNGQTVTDAATATIEDNDEPTVEVGNPELSAGDVTVTEGDTAVFGVQVTNAAAGSSLTLSLADGTALDADYFASGDGGFFEYSSDGGSTWSAITGAIALDAGDTTLQVRTDTIDDAIDESAETFSLNAVLTSNGQTVTDAATATIEDNDDDVPTKVTATALSVDEDDISSAGNPGGLGDLSTAQTSGSITYDLGSDTPLQSLALSTSTPVFTIDGTEVVTTWDANSNTLIGYRSGGSAVNDQVFTIAVTNIGDSSADTEVTLFEPLRHHLLIAADDTETDLTIDVDVTVIDQDGSSGSTSFSVVVDDDTPEFTNVADSDGNGVVNLSAPNIDATYTQQLADWSYGADGESPGLDIANMSGSAEVVTANASQVIIDLKDADGGVAGTLTLNADGEDSLEVFARTPELTTDTLLTGDVSASGPALTKTIDSTISGLVVTVSASDGDADLNEAKDDEVNPSAQGWAVADNQVDPGESMTFGFSSPVNTFEFATTGLTGGKNKDGVASLNIQVTYDDGSSSGILLANPSENGKVVVQDLTGFDTNKAILSITVASAEPSGGDGFRLNNVSVGKYISNEPPSLDYAFTLGGLTLTDGDGDSAEQAFQITLEGSATGSFSTTPIALDLDNDGVEYLSRDAGVIFTDDATGESVNTAWVAGDDGLLVIDANQSGTVDESREYVFTEWSETAKTDMQAVAEAFDTNQDGVLDARDERFDQFAVWQDVDSDGVTDEGELVSLGEFGIESIALNYNENSEARTEADGDVSVHGQSSVTWTDGDVTLAEDASFAIDMADLLTETADEMEAYFQASFDGSDTVVQVSKEGAFTGGSSDVEHVDQTITFEGVDMIGDLGAGAAIQAMIENGQLDIE